MAERNAPVETCPVRPCVGSGCRNWQECKVKKDGRALRK